MVWNYFTIRGEGQEDPKDTMCDICGDVIKVGEQYFYDKDIYYKVCLGCYTNYYKEDFHKTFKDDPYYHPKHQEV